MCSSGPLVDVTALYDTGTEDNWMSGETVKRIGISQFYPDEDTSVVTFNGEEFKSSFIVEAKLALEEDCRSPSFLFHVAPTNSPFEVLLGYKLLLEEGIITINDKWPKRALVLAKKPNKKSTCQSSGVEVRHHLLTDNVTDVSCNTVLGDLESTEGSKKKADAAHDGLLARRNWMKKMQDERWTWDVKSQNFFRLDAKGNKTWSQGQQ
jgi:hypothetical protein